MAKMSRTPVSVAAGDAFLVPLENGRFSGCRVLRVDEANGCSLVVNSAWTDTQCPSDPIRELREILLLTHHSWNGKASVAWVGGPPPDEYIRVGTITPSSDDDLISEGGFGAWPFFRFQPMEQWYWDHPEERPPPDTPPKGLFRLRRFNGIELFSLHSASILAYESENGSTIWFEVEAHRDALQRCEDTVEYPHWPKAEVSIEISQLDADQLVGREFVIPGTQSDDEDSCMSSLYYSEHQPLRNNSIVVMSRSDNRFWLRWTATTPDINFYDGSKPPAHVEIEGDFVFKDVSKWIPK